MYKQTLSNLYIWKLQLVFRQLLTEVFTPQKHSQKTTDVIPR